MCKTTGQAKLVPYMKAKLTDAFITKVNCATAEDGVVQKVEMVFKQIEIEYLPQSGKGSQTGQLGTGAFNYKWNISAGTVGGGGG
jgi:type VI protein secretion system component Hcp